MMLARLLAVLLLCACVGLAPAGAQMTTIGVGQGDAGGGSSACSQATAWLGRVTTSFSTAYTTMICGMVTDGTWATLDTFYVLATDNPTNALLNLVSSSFPLTATGTPTFTANSGYAGTAAAGQKLGSTYNFSTNGTNFTQNSATLFGWSTQTANDNNCIVGDSTGGFTILLNPFDFGSTLNADVNQNFPGLQSSILASGVGLFVGTRTGATAVTLYQNTTSVATGTGASVARPNGTLQGLLCGTGTSFGGNVGALGTAGGWTSTQESNFFARLHTFLHTVNATLYP